MRRAPVHVRVVTEEDLEALRPMWEEFLDQPGLIPDGAPDDVLAKVRSALQASQLATDAGRGVQYRLVIASMDGQDVGFASLSVLGHGLLTESAAVVVDAMHVSPSLRKRGIGTELLREAIVLADEVGAVDIVVNTPARGRDVNRFYARNGFSAMVVRRSAPVAGLRRKLGVEPRLDLRDTTIELSPIQRTLRRRAVLTRRPARP